MDNASGKAVFGVLLASFAGVVLFIVNILIIELLRHGFNNSEPGLILIWPAFNVVGVVVSAVKLKGYYSKQPPDWTGRWQLSMLDMIAVTFVFAGIMAFFKFNMRPDEFFPPGAVLSLSLGAVYLFSLLLVTRIGNLDTVGRWMWALALVFIEVILTGIQLLVQGFVLMWLFPD